MYTRGDVRERLRPGAEVLVRVSEIGPLADQPDRQGAGAPTLADTRVENGCFASRVRANEQQGIRLLDSGNAGVEEIARPPPRRIEHRAVLPAIQIGHAEPRHQILEREDFLDRCEIADDGAHAPGLGLLDLGGDDPERVAPRGGVQPAVLADVRLIEALRAQTVDHVPGLVGNPLLVHLVVDARENAHDLASTRIDADGGADRVHDVDRFGFGEFPGTRGERIRFGGKRADRA